MKPDLREERIARLLGALSVHSMFASALVLLACFIVWQWRTHASWEISSRRLEEIKRIITEVSDGITPFKIKLDDLGVFPGLRQGMRYRYTAFRA